jgi:3D (Asp-Asp-Asp) domain-containing protein
MTATVVSRGLLILALILFVAPVRALTYLSETYVATAYSLRGRTASGTWVAKGTIAADPRVLKMGSRVFVDAPGTAHDGLYVVRDTGGKIKKRRIDIWMPSRKAAIQFGVRSVRVTRL